MSKRTCCTDFHLYGACKHTAEATARLSGSTTRFMRNNAEDIRLHTQAIINPAPTQRQELQQQTPQNLALHGTLTHEECATILHGLRLIQCEGRIEGCAAGDCEHFEDTPALTNDQIDALAERINFDAVSTDHPQTDEHLAGCTSCMMAHDKALPDAVLPKSWSPAECPNYTQLVAVTEALQDAHDIHVWDGGTDDPDHTDTNCHMCEVLAAANAQIDAHQAKIAGVPLNTEDAIASAIDRDKAKGIDWQGVGVIDTMPVTTNADECIRLCEAIAAFWGDCCDAAIWPGAYITEEDTPIRDLVRAAIGWRKP